MKMKQNYLRKRLFKQLKRVQKLSSSSQTKKRKVKTKIGPLQTDRDLTENP